MSMISNLVKRLRSYSNVSLCARELETKRLLKQAADTIEELSVKLATVNKEQSVQYGDWIPCDERLPENAGYYLALSDNDYKDIDVLNYCCGRWKRKYDNSEVSFVKYWMPLPKFKEKQL